MSAPSHRLWTPFAWFAAVVSILGLALAGLIGPADGASAAVERQAVTPTALPLHAALSPTAETAQLQAVQRAADQPITSEEQSPAARPPGHTTAAGGMSTPVQPQVIGGKPVPTIADAPWVVNVRTYVGAPPLTIHPCAGALISATQVVTAAHCLYDSSGTRLDVETGTIVTAGETDLTSGAGQERRVSSAWIDPRYSVDSSGVYHNDDAVLTLDQAISSTYATPIALPTSADSADWAPGTSATLYGWGSTTGGGGLSNTLQSVSLPVISDSACLTANASYSAQQMLCAGFPASTTPGGACLGDDGGPLVVNGVLIGITSYYGAACSPTDGYSYFTRVVNYVSSITAAPVAEPRTTVEAEALMPLLTTNLGTPGSTAGVGSVSIQNNCCGVTWSGGQQLLVYPTGTSQSVSAIIDAGHKGSYDLSAVFTKASDFGQITVSVDGGQLGPIFDGYSSTVTTATQDFGAVNLDAGPHAIAFTAVGKDSAAGAYHFGVDLIHLTPTGAVTVFDAASLAQNPGPSTASASGQANCCGAFWSGGQQLWIQSTAASRYVSFTLSLGTTADYDLTGVFTRAPDYGQWAITIDGNRVGRAGDGYDTTVHAVTDDLGPVHLAAGNHTFTLTITGKNSNSAGYYMGINTLTFAQLPPTTVVEGESEVGSLGAGSTAASSQANCCGITWYGDHQLWIRSTAAGQYVSFPVTAPTTGDYDLTAFLTRSTDYGEFQLSVDGTNVGPLFEGYAGSLYELSKDYGVIPLTAGSHTVKLTVTGKNASSTNYYAGLDRLVLTQYGNATTSEAENLPTPTALQQNITPIVQSDCCNVNWSGGKQVWLSPKTSGTAWSMGFTVTVSAAGTYDVGLRTTTAPDYGIVHYDVDGTDLGPTFDGYNGVAAVTPLDLGSITLTAGTHTLYLNAHNANPAATNDNAGVDTVTLNQTG